MMSIAGDHKKEQSEPGPTWHQYLGQYMAAGVNVSWESSQSSTPHLLQGKQQQQQPHA
jgi:hypothetical protein